MKNSITLEEGPYGTYVIIHDDGRDLLVQSDWDYPATAMTFGWNPCCRCRRLCKGASDGTIDCQRRTASEHIDKAQIWLDAHIGKRVDDPGYFEPITYPCNPNVIRAVYTLAYEHHSGEWSRGYRLLCRIQRYARKHGIDLDCETRASRRLYYRLTARYGDKM